MAANLSTLKDIEAARRVLSAKEAAGEVVPADAWIELGDAQSALLPTTREGYYL